MENEKLQIDKIDYYIRLVLKQRWCVIIPFCIAMVVGIFLSLTMPNVYSASNLILVIPRQVPDKYVPDVLATDVQQRIATIRQQIMSQSNLEKLIDQLKLFSGDEYRGMYLIDKIDVLRKNTEVKVTKSGDGKGINSFTIEYKGGDPQQVMQVVNSLADSFINESVKIMESEVIETNKFLDEELKTMRGKLNEIERSIEEYRQKHIGELPEELNSNLTTITRFQEQMSEKEQSMRDAKYRLATIEDRIAFLRSNRPSFDRPAIPSMPNVPDTGSKTTPVSSELDQLRQALNQAMTRYTDKHPDVVRLKSMIALRENMAPPAPKDTDASGATDAAQASASYAQAVQQQAYQSEQQKYQLAFEKAMFDLDVQQKEIKREIDDYKKEMDRLTQEIQQYQKRVENTPKIKHEIGAMERIYENLQQQYDHFRNRKMDSDIAVNMGRDQKGEKVRVLDSARRPQKPISPDIRIILAACVAIGLGIGGGIIFLVDYFDNTLKIPEEVESIYKIPMLATIPDLVSGKDRMRQRLNHAFTLVSLMVAFLLFSVMGVFAIKGVDKTVAFAKKLMTLA